MQILFITRIKPEFEGGISPIIKNQGDSLIRIGHSVEYYIVDKGIYGYLSLLFKLGRFLRQNTFDIIHSHYSITSIFAALAVPRKRIFVSLMGSDTARKGLLLLLIKLFSMFIWKRVIVKSEKMKTLFNNKNITVLPNGVDFEKFVDIPKNDAQQRVEFSPLTKNVLFLADPNRKEKNVQLARDAIELLSSPLIVLHEIYPVANDMVPFYLNAADVLVLPSIYEGSVNIVKEAMACCIPIVSTDVGDVKENISSTEGCYIAQNNPTDFSSKIKLALDYGKKTNGRQNIQHLNSNAIAHKLVEIYLSN